MPLKGWPSWGGHFNRPQLSHCRKPLTAPYSLSRTALLLGSQAVMQKDLQPGPLTTHPRPQGQPAPNSSQPPKRVLVFESKAGDPALIWRKPCSLHPGLSARGGCGASRGFPCHWFQIWRATTLVPGPWAPAPAPSRSRTAEMAEASTAPSARSGQGNPGPPPQAVPGSSRPL